MKTSRYCVDTLPAPGVSSFRTRTGSARRLAAHALAARLGGEAPAVLLGGLTHPPLKSATPYPALTGRAHNGWRNNLRLGFSHGNPLYRRPHAGTPRQFECAPLITAAWVIATPKRIPRLIERAAPMQAAEAAKEAAS